MLIKPCTWKFGYYECLHRVLRSETDFMDKLICLDCGLKMDFNSFSSLCAEDHLNRSIVFPCLCSHADNKQGYEATEDNLPG